MDQSIGHLPPHPLTQQAIKYLAVLNARIRMSKEMLWMLIRDSHWVKWELQAECLIIVLITELCDWDLTVNQKWGKLAAMTQKGSRKSFLSWPWLSCIAKGFDRPSSVPLCRWIFAGFSEFTGSCFISAVILLPSLRSKCAFSNLFFFFAALFCWSSLCFPINHS